MTNESQVAKNANNKRLFNWKNFSTTERAGAIALLVLLGFIAWYILSPFVGFHGHTSQYTASVDALTGEVKSPLPSKQQLFGDEQALHDGRSGFKLTATIMKDPSNDYKDTPLTLDLPAFTHAEDKDGDPRDADIAAAKVAYDKLAQKFSAHIPRMNYDIVFVDKTDKTGTANTTFVTKVIDIEKTIAEIQTSKDGLTIIFAPLTGEFDPTTTKVVIQPGKLTDGDSKNLRDAATAAASASDGSKTSVIYPAISYILGKELKGVNSLAQVHILIISDMVENSYNFTDVSLYRKNGEIKPEDVSKLDQKTTTLFKPPHLGENTYVRVVKPLECQSQIKTVLMAFDYASHWFPNNTQLKPDNFSAEVGDKTTK